MYILFFVLLLLSGGALARTLLCKTHLPGGVVVLIVLLVGIAASALLYCLAIYCSVFAFQWNDPIIW